MRAYFKAADLWLRARHGPAYRWAHLIAPLAVLVLAVVLRGSPGGLADEIKNRVFDQLQRWQPRPYEPLPVRVVDIDDQSLAKLGQWPWPRTLLARLVDALGRQGAAVVSFDVLFSEPDRTSPARVASLWPDSPAARAMKEQLKSLPDHDLLFAKVMERVPVVGAFSLLGEKNGMTPAAKAHFSIGGDSPLPFVPAFLGAVVPLRVLENAAAGNGSMDFIPEPDGIVRRAPLLFRCGKALLPALSIEALRVAQGANAYAVKASGYKQASREEVAKSMAKGDGGASQERRVDRVTENFGQHTGISKIKVGKLIIPTDQNGRVWVYYTAAAPERTVPAWCVFDKK